MLAIIFHTYQNLLQKLILTDLFKKFPAFMKPNGSLSYSGRPLVGSFSELVGSIWCLKMEAARSSETLVYYLDLDFLFSVSILCSVEAETELAPF